ncbi:MAG: Glu-tRNA(Gln) amidotransferase subunit GatE [archaeon]|jgi:Glu-tRNA(Gln) amidotransferase subunit E-like FAD-binding protein|nr:Glu-tRNA(Gln) amidotransferase subunit GatE [archaeon]
MEEGSNHDYAKLGLMAGLEIHQQLDTGKLFCSCPGYLRSEKPDFEVHRKLHAVAGETGEVDVAAMHEAKLNRDFVYQGYKENVCLVDLDEEPPHLINQNALDEALKIAILMNCEIYPVSQVMRKTVIDGSNTSGFQRTVLIAHDGYIETSFGKVGIASIALEEDAARIVEEDSKKAVYKLDRLGIPLVEVVTKPDMNTPGKIKEAALKIGDILRACKVRRGIGTIRQDLNVSIKGHNRVEVKGFQDPKMMIKTVDLEIERQIHDLKNKKKEGEVRNALPDGKTEFSRPMPGQARMYPETDLPLLRVGREKTNLLKKNLPKLRQEIRDELKKEGVSEEFIPLVVENLDEFNVLMRVYDKDANLIAKMLALWPNEFSTKLGKPIEEIRKLIDEVVLEKVLEKLKAGKIDAGDIKGILLKVVSGENVDDALKVEKMGDDELELAIANIVKEKPGLRANAYMGMVIAKLKGVDKRKAMEILNRVVK